RGDQRLALEANLADVAARQQLLDRDIAGELAVARARHPAEAAAPVLGQDLIAVAVADLVGGERVRGRLGNLGRGRGERNAGARGGQRPRRLLGGWRAARGGGRWRRNGRRRPAHAAVL